MSGTNEWEKAKGVLAPYFPDGVKSDDLLNGEHGGPGGTNADLRARLRKFAEPAKCEDVDDYDRYTEQVLDHLFAEIAASGQSIVDTGRLERLLVAAGHYEATNPRWRSVLQPGDLDPVEGGR